MQNAIIKANKRRVIVMGRSVIKGTTYYDVFMPYGFTARNGDRGVWLHVRPERLEIDEPKFGAGAPVVEEEARQAA